MDASNFLVNLGLDGSGYAAPVHGGTGAGYHEHDLVTPASVMKIQVALTVENLIARGDLDGGARLTMPASPRTPGPVGVSLMQDDVTMSVRDLVVAMLTISDNVATDALIALVGLDRINLTTRTLGLDQTLITSDLRTMLEEIAREVGFEDFEGLVNHTPAEGRLPSGDEVAERIRRSVALDPARGTRTTAFETVSLLQSIWSDRAGEPRACRKVRDTMSRQLNRNRIAQGFDASAVVAAKSGALLGVVRNEAGVVSFPDGSAFAVAVFTRRGHGSPADPWGTDAAIGRSARSLVDALRDGEQ